ncbi:S-adenosyl-L-methionine-dependent methyltransferase [Polychytrium aggregatum]|uniref:S-adenosyl-L-methionine-dependent methyltransferase n=1 Tax=Polychytrium aggregatum TaxID=110093 RepID=UPI0022FF0232|nr:S-adenosyl-L-methionine-dependent methyltransferase [Polychytrium aggregatum]KAI9197384.1 S-adenosyl-L-methionine-dependent methyltransferase [Polychytrium aggregatum]
MSASDDLFSKRKSEAPGTVHLQSLDKKFRLDMDAHVEELGELRVLEFFSGIGGLHYGLELAAASLGRALKLVASFDINENANSCYAHNFGIKPSVIGIEFLNKAKLDSFKANCWLLSPPCQPYTAGGKMLDDEDNRAAGLINLIAQLKVLETPPQYFFLENVPNFEASRSRERLVNTLDDLGYKISEFLVSPLQFGMSNDRRRYYLCASRTGSHAKTTRYIDQAQIHTQWPIPGVSMIQNYPEPPMLMRYLEDLADPSQYMVPPEYILKRKGFRFDIVQPTDSRCSTFTKAYGTHHVVGSGSFLQTQNLEQTYDLNDPEALLTLGLRFFTPTEVARLHFFPVDRPNTLHEYDDLIEAADSVESPVEIEKHTLDFPRKLSIQQQWKLLGNSLNVKVVGTLMRDVMLKGKQAQSKRQ